MIVLQGLTARLRVAKVNPHVRLEIGINRNSHDAGFDIPAPPWTLLAVINLQMGRDACDASGEIDDLDVAVELGNENEVAGNGHFHGVRQVRRDRLHCEILGRRKGARFTAGLRSSQ